MVSESQRQFNKFIDGYMDKRQRSWRDGGSIFSFSKKPKEEQLPKAKQPAPARVDKVVLLAEKEMDMTLEPKKKGSKGLLGGLKEFLFGSSEDEVKLTKEDIDRLDDEEDFKIENIHQAPRPIQKQVARVAPQSAGAANAYFSDALRKVSNTGSSQPQQRSSGSPGLSSTNFRPVAAAAPERRVEVGRLEENFPYNPTTEKDFTYLLGLINTLLNKLEKSKRDEFYRSSEFRIFESIRKKH